MADRLFSNLRRSDGASLDILVRDGIVAAMDRPGTVAAPAAERIDCGGQLLLPPLVEPHVHLDKTLWGLPWRPCTAGPALSDYIANERKVLAALTVPISVRSAGLLEHCIAQGSLAIRSHIDVAPDIGLSHVEGMLALRARYGDLCDMQFVAFPQTGLLTSPGTAALMEEALGLGVEIVGGIDPAGIDGDPIGHLKAVFGMAERHGRGVDIHLHDRGELGLWQIDRIADFTAAAGLHGKVMISHAYSLGMAPEARIARLARRLADLGISIMTAVPIDPGAPPVAYLRAAGVNVCCGSDGIRDSWSPMGNGDMLERAFLLAFRFDWSRDEELAAAFDCATAAAARATGMGDGALAPGRPADFLYLPATTLGDALCRRPRQRTVVRRGAIVAADGRLLGSRLG